MKILPTSVSFFKTLWWTLFVSSLLVNAVALWGWYICSTKWNEILEVARFNDLDGDGTSSVIIVYK